MREVSGSMIGDVGMCEVVWEVLPSVRSEGHGHALSRVRDLVMHGMS